MKKQNIGNGMLENTETKKLGGKLTVATTDKERLTTLLSYLIDHNRSHAGELRELTEKVKGTDKAAVGDRIAEAAQLLDSSTESLNKALSALREG